MTNVLSDHEFASVHQPISNHADPSAPFGFGSLEGTPFESFGGLAFVELQACEMIWTLLTIAGHVTIVRS